MAKEQKFNKALSAYRYEEPDTWETIARALFNLLDDIDTHDDLAKDNEQLYRNLVRKSHAERFKFATTDGYTVNFNVVPDA